jgi:hypothetical protein
MARCFEDVFKNGIMAGCWWLSSIILATLEAEIGRIVDGGQPRQIILKTPSPKKPEQNGLEVWTKG